MCHNSFDYISFWTCGHKHAVQPSLDRASAVVDSSLFFGAYWILMDLCFISWLLSHLSLVRQHRARLIHPQPTARIGYQCHHRDIPPFAFTCKDNAIIIWAGGQIHYVLVSTNAVNAQSPGVVTWHVTSPTPLGAHLDIAHCREITMNLPDLC